MQTNIHSYFWLTIFCFGLFFWTNAIGYAQEAAVVRPFRIVLQKKASGEVEVWAYNRNYIAYQCQIDEYRPTADYQTPQLLPAYWIIPPQTDSLLLVLRPAKADPGRAVVSYSSFMGNPKAVHIDTTRYWLPFAHGKARLLSQGYNGAFSHKKQYALDFKLRAGTPLYAARGGVVVDTKHDSDSGGKGAEFSDKANYIRIVHTDGSIASYLHLKKDGVLVSIGDSVVAGQPIGFSGSTGWSTAPHLHFEVRQPVYMGRKSIPTYFINKRWKNKRLRWLCIYQAYHPDKDTRRPERIQRLQQKRYTTRFKPHKSIR
jgi:murein DD-endopeptidase MepM/ murein hydrolase activator NlpD